MDERGSSSVKIQQQVVPPTIMAALGSAVLEWFLIFLLLIDASFSYLITKFALYSKLPIPCLLCSRLDHFLGDEKAEFCWDLMCKKHKLKISSLVLCHLHDNLVDVHGMCESCLFSFATVNKSNTETYRLLVGKLGDKPHVGLDQDSSIANGLSSVNAQTCSCCSEQFNSGGPVQFLFPAKSNGSDISDLEAPLLATDECDRDELKEIRDISPRRVRACLSGKNDIDPLPHIEYEKVKITSDTESEASLSGDDSASNLIHLTNSDEKDLAADYSEKDLVVDDLASEKLIDSAVVPEPSMVDSEVNVEASDLHCISPPAPIGHGLEELNWDHAEQKIDGSVPSELISFCEVLPSANFAQSSVGASEESLDTKKISHLGKEAVKDSDEMAGLASNITLTNEKQADLKSSTSDSSLLMPNFLELGDAYKIAVGSRGRQLSGKFLEQKSLKDSVRLSEDLKILLSQLSAARGIELPLNDISPRISGNIDELRTSNASSSIGMQILQRRISLERNESGISLDGSTVSEIEGESVVERLKRQVEHDKKLMGALYKELEEERNASAVAANQAMAMITRLQEEKAAIHMEALQCLRMMEEQAEYDGEALLKANDLLAEKENEIQDLEAQLEVHKKGSGDICPTEKVLEPKCELNVREVSIKHLDANSEQKNISVSSSGSNLPATCKKIDQVARFTGDQDMMKSSLLEFEDETLYILQCLKKLERKLELFSNDEGFVNMADGDISYEESVKVSDWKHFDCSGNALKNGETNVDHLLEHAIIHKDSHSAQEGSASQHEDPQQPSSGSGALESGRHFCRDSELGALRNEFLFLSGRLESLEAEHSFLEHSISSLSKGEEGLKLIKEIACQVRELHSIGIRRRS